MELDGFYELEKKRTVVESNGRGGSTQICPKLPPIPFLPPKGKVEGAGVANIATAGSRRKKFNLIRDQLELRGEEKCGKEKCAK